MDIGKGDKIRVVREGVVKDVFDEAVVLQNEGGGGSNYSRKLYTFEVIEKAGHDHASDPYGTMYVDDEGHKWIKLPSSYDSGVVYRRIDKWSVINEETDSANRLSTLKPINDKTEEPRPEVGDTPYGWQDCEGDNWWYVKLSNGEYGWVQREDRPLAEALAEATGIRYGYRELPEEYAPYTVIS